MSAYLQLPLPLRFDQSCSFDHYYSDDDFEAHLLKTHLDSTLEPLLLINGEHSTGKSHLLNATALYCHKRKVPFQYFEAKMLREVGTEMIAPCQKGHVLIIDDIQYLAQDAQWERKLYDLFNDAQRHQWMLVVSCLRTELDSFELKDWLSRLKSGVQVALTKRDEQSLKNIIQFRSKLLGLKLKSEVIDYLLVHFSRDLSVQIKLLKCLDARALEKNRNITIPFIKETLVS